MTAAEDIYLSYHDKVSSYIRGKVDHHQDAEDLVSQVFEKVYGKLHTFDETKASQSTWIYTITRNTVTDYYRIEYIYGTLDVTPAYLTLEAVSAEKRYDGEPLSDPAYFMTQGELMPGHFLAECAVEGERTMIGRSSNVITRVVICNEFGEDVTANYSIQTIDGVLRVRP